VKLFLRFFAVSCVCLLTWHQATLHSEWEPVSVALGFAGVLAAYLCARGRRFGYSLGLVLGIGYAVEICLRSPNLTASSPFLAWALGLTLTAALSLWLQRPARVEEGLERHAQF
jgi:hypothetical protein